MMSQSHVIKSEMSSSLPYISHGKGIYLYDQDGKKYIDGCSGAVTANIGHGVTEVIEAMNKQANKVSFAFKTHFFSEATESLGKKLANWAPGSLNRCFFVNSGSEATEMARKVAVQYWQEQGFNKKNRVISRWMSYHGNTIESLSMSGHVLRRKSLSHLLKDYPAIQSPYYYRCDEDVSLKEYGLRCANELELAIHRLGAENIAAFIAEPIIGASGGAIVPPPGYFKRIREICDEYNILFIADEVMTGMGRTGKNFGVDHWDVVPDFMALGKGMTAGYTPMAATIMTDEIFDVIYYGSGEINSGHTYSGNPQSTATALAVVKYIEDNNLVRNSFRQGEYLREKLTELMNKYEIVGDVRGLGLLNGIEFVKSKESKEPFALSAGITKMIIEKAFSKGLIVYPASGAIEGRAGDAILVAPPLTVTKDEINQITSILLLVILEVQEEVSLKTHDS